VKARDQGFRGEAVRGEGFRRQGFHAPIVSKRGIRRHRQPYPGAGQLHGQPIRTGPRPA
jgi:hypothetical protein